MLLELWLPIVVSTVALFFASFLSWMVLPLHFDDWRKLDQEDDFVDAARKLAIPTGNYMFPGWNTRQEMNSDEVRQKWEAGPRGILSVYPEVSMGKNLGLTFLFFLAVSFCLAYLSTLALSAGAAFADVFRFVATAGLLTFLGAMVQHSIWFHNRIIGHVIESIAYAAITGAIFAWLWPGA